MITYEQVENTRSKAEGDVDQVEWGYLESRGWKHTCKVPGAYWVWVKDIDHEYYGKMSLMAAQSMAVRMEESLNPDPIEDDSEDGNLYGPR